MFTIRRRLPVFTAVLLATASLPIQAQTTQLYWGDTHLHTSHSTDAYGSGNLKIDPEMAYRFAKGQPILHPTLNSKLRIARALDFLVVADHSDYLGLQVYLQKDDPRLTGNAKGKKLREMALADPGSVFRLIFAPTAEFTPETLMETYKPIMMQPWLDEIAAAERHNQPGVFTAFAGWEWSSHKDNRNLHRVVFSDASPAQLSQFFPYSNLESTRPEDLWAWLEKTSKATGADFIAMPHNSNMSDGLMFAPKDSEGKPFTLDYARTRERWEPVAEITQVKGTSEVHPVLSPSDEFAEFEIFRRLFFNKEPTPNKGDYLRSGLMTGLELERQLGVNPMRLGFIGSSDIHTGLSMTTEEEFGGAVARDIMPATRQAAPRNRPANLSAAPLSAWELSASGLAAVWATENTRKGIADAFRRKEVYATSGTRIALRVFGGFDFVDADANNTDIAKIGYAKGKAMGSDLAKAGSGKKFSLLIHAAKDPSGANLDRVQVIKGWLDASGVSHDKVFDVAWSSGRQLTNGKLPPVGSTVNVQSARYTNSIGTAQLATVWRDPEFDPAQSAFYYVRVLEIPTPRHQVYDAVTLGMPAADTAQPLQIQERAWSSPLWYRP